LNSDTRDPQHAPPAPREIWDDLWSRLCAGARSAKHPFHLGAFATVRDGRPEQRTVVLRAVEPRRHQLLFHTDARSSKVAALAACPEASWLFYDAEEKIQLRIACSVRVHRDGPLVEDRWAGSRLSSRACYVHRDGPGTPLATPLEYGPVQPADAEDPEALTAPGITNFTVIATTAHRIDWLSLHHAGHRRMRFNVTPLGFDSLWIAP
jgi:3-hydroxyisobutyrate dehydrogenase